MDEMYLKTVGTVNDEDVIRMYRHKRDKKRKEKIWSLRRFVSQNREIVRNMCVVLAALLVTNLLTFVYTKRDTTVEMQKLMASQIAAASFRTEQETMARMKEQYGINAENAEKAVMEEEAKVVAKVLYAMRNNREAGLHLACWAIFDRVDSLRYSDDVYSVCSAKDAFMGWSDGNDVLDNLYKIALEEVQRWHRGIRPLSASFVYLYWTPSEIYLFDDSGHKFFESDWLNYIDSQKE